MCVTCPIHVCEQFIIYYLGLAPRHEHYGRVKVVPMFQVLVMDQTSVPFVHRMSVVSVLAPMETVLYLLRRHRSLPPEETAAPYLLRRLLLLIS
ncbi:hypothetical protein Tco_0778814 [Tanacetum coccineum]